LHDAVAAERAGVPAIGVMTTQFVSAAELMGHVLGLTGYAFAVIEHPVSSATDAGLRLRAQDTIVQARSLLLRS
jgi:hypothetical protein